MFVGLFLEYNCFRFFFLRNKKMVYCGWKMRSFDGQELSGCAKSQRIPEHSIFQHTVRRHNISRILPSRIGTNWNFPTLVSYNTYCIPNNFQMGIKVFAVFFLSSMLTLISLFVVSRRLACVCRPKTDRTPHSQAVWLKLQLLEWKCLGIDYLRGNLVYCKGITRPLKKNVAKWSTHSGRWSSATRVLQLYMGLQSIQQ